MTTFAIDPSLSDDLASEKLPNLDDFVEDVGGSWPKGWYAAEIIEGYTTRKGTVFETGDEPSKNGDSRNLRLCLKLRNAKGEERTIQDSVNYRITDFTAERLAFIKEAREEYKGVKGRWPNADAQRSSLAVANVGAIQKATGDTFGRTPAGSLDPSTFIGKRVDVRLSINEKDYNEVSAYDKAGAKATHPKA